MENIFILLAEIFVICFLFGVVYPACAILIYPFYKLIGGKRKFLDYMGSL